MKNITVKTVLQTYESILNKHNQTDNKQQKMILGLKKLLKKHQKTEALEAIEKYKQQNMS